MPGQKFSRICGTKIQLILGDARRPEDKAWNKMPTAWEKGRRGAVRVARGRERSGVLGEPNDAALSCVLLVVGKTIINYATTFACFGLSCLLISIATA